MWVMRQIVWICHRSWCTDPMWSHCLICISMTTSKLQHVLKCFLLLFSRSVMSDCLRPHWLRHTRLPCPSPSPGTSSNLCPLSQWCHPTISASVIPFSSCLQSFPASGSLLMSRLFASGGQSTEVSASKSFLQWIFRTDFLWDWLVGSPCSPRDAPESSPIPQFKSISSLVLSFL